MKTLKLLSAVAVVAALAVTGVTQAHAKSSEDFVKNASIGGNYEVQSSQIALEKSNNDSVKAFAQQMVDDHTKASDKLKEILPSTSVDPSVASDGLDKKHQKMIDKLNKLSGKKFDKEYIKQQTKAHKETVSLFKDEAKSGDDDNLKQFASDTLPTLEQHLEHVKTLKANQ